LVLKTWACLPHPDLQKALYHTPAHAHPCQLLPAALTLAAAAMPAAQCVAVVEQQREKVKAAQYDMPCSGLQEKQ
jgi:hypothetical protein